MCKHISWGNLYQLRRQAEEHFGTIFQLPIERKVREVLLQEIRPTDHVLEVGAGDRSMREHLIRKFANVNYLSMDIDRHSRHDFYSLEEIQQTFDGIFAFEVIEHLTLDQIQAWLVRLQELTRPGGKLLLSTPNTYYPPAYLRDVTHQTPLCFDELAALVTAAGYEVKRIVRIYHDPVHRKFLRRYLLGWLFRTIGIDFARQIVLVAEKR